MQISLFQSPILGRFIRPPFFQIMTVCALCLSLNLSVSFSAHAQQSFASCIANLTEQAVDRGISTTTIDKTLRVANQLERVVKADRSQPEFVSTFEDYYVKRVNEWRIKKGLEKLEEHRGFLQQLTRQYGVPGPYLIAFWGLETNYGNFKGKIPTIDALSTLACDKRRKSFFTNELLTMLEVIEVNQLDVSTLRGSWAGALGHTQFMPTTYKGYAIDGDGDNSIDLYNSEKDALASAANFLAQLGWQPGYRWGREILLPEGFDYALADRKKRHPLSFWQAQGVKTVYAQPLPDADIEAAVIVPSGYNGPVFLAYRNFNIIMRWNASQSYAIAVGKLAEILSGAPNLVTPFPDAPPLSVAAAKQLQQDLKQLGYLSGPVDGIIGSGSRAAIRQFQLDNNLVADGFAHPEVLSLAAIRRQEKS